MNWVKVTKAVLLFWMPAVLFFGSAGCWWHHDHDHDDHWDHHDDHHDDHDHPDYH